MAPAMQTTARIFEDPPVKSIGYHHFPHADNMYRGGQQQVESDSRHSFPNNDCSGPSPLGERHINSPPQPKKIPLKDEDCIRPPMHKKSGSASSLKALLMRKDRKNDEDASKPSKSESSPKKTKSSASIVGLLKKKSRRNLLDTEEGEPQRQQPHDRAASDQTRKATAHNDQELDSIRVMDAMRATGSDIHPQHKRIQSSISSEGDLEFSPPKRPFLAHKSSRSSIFTEDLSENDVQMVSQRPKSGDWKPSPGHIENFVKRSPAKKENIPMNSIRPDMKSKRSSKIFDTIAALNMKSRHDEQTGRQQDPVAPLSPQDLDSEMENMLGRYDIPQNLRDQLRNLKPEVKAGLMKGERTGTGLPEQNVRDTVRTKHREEKSFEGADKETKDGKRSRSRSRPRSRILSLSKRNDSSPSKGEATIRSRSKSRSKSVDVTSSTTHKGISSAASVSNLSGSESAVTPGDFIHYLREVQKPELIEVGKIHKLRILLRNESVAWTDSFVRKGGMDEIVQLLYRIMDIEWREEHEDNLLHETLLCLKGLSTTKLAMQSLEVIGIELFPALLRMLFDPERKGPSEYSTRGIIVSLVFAYLSATLHNGSKEHEQRARHILTMMQDKKPMDGKQPLEFVTQMHMSRPYRMWCKEATNVTKEVFWIFLHHMNVIPIGTHMPGDEIDYAHTYFPSLRAPHPAAPYVGGVEWEATQYLALHLDLLNGLIVSIPTLEERNCLREELRQSGWEKLMGGSLRTCKEKFYGGVHEGLKSWVAAAVKDGWLIEDVRAGPPREVASPKKSPERRKQKDEAPQISLDIDTPGKVQVRDDWL